MLSEPISLWLKLLLSIFTTSFPCGYPLLSIYVLSQVEDVGPFLFEETRRKTNIEFDDEYEEGPLVSYDLTTIRKPHASMLQSNEYVNGSGKLLLSESNDTV